MKIREVLRKFIPYIVLIALVIGSVLIGRIIRSFQIIVGGILGFAVLYFMFRFHSLPTTNRIIRSSSDDYPKSIEKIIYLLVLGIVCYLAIYQLLNLILWLIKVPLLQ